MYFATGAAFTAAINALPTSLTGTYKAFDAFYYADKYMASYSGTLSPVEHFVQLGAARGNKPNANFDPAYYQATFTDLANLDAADLVFHYVKFGLNEGRAGNAVLKGYDWAGYLAAYPDVAKYVADNLASFGGSTTNGAIAHYVKFGEKQGFSVPGSVIGGVFTLSTGVDNGAAFKGSSGSDTFSAPLSSNIQTLGGLDNLDGGVGSDSLAAIVNSGTVVIPSGMTSIETVTVSSTAAGSGISLQNATGVTTAEIASSSATSSITGISSTAVGLKATANSADVTFTFSNAAVTGSADSVTVTANGQSGAVTVNSDGSSGVETINIVSTGGTNNITNLSVAGSSGTSTASKLVATGSATLTLGTAAAAAADAVELATSIKTIDLSGASGTTTIFLDAASPTVTGGSGNDTINLNAAGTASVVGGAGNDRINFYDFATGTDNAPTGTFDIADTIDGGDGTDTLALEDVQATVTTTQTKVSNIERIAVVDVLTAGADLNATFFGSGVNYVTLSKGTAGAATITTNSGDSTVALSAITGGATAFVASGTGTSDTVTVVSGLTAGTTALAAASAVTATGVETLTIGAAAAVASTVASVTMTGTGGAATKFAVTGGYGFTSTAAIEAKTVDASGLTVGTSSTGLVMGAVATTNTSQTITGSGGADTLLGGAGNDSITAGDGNDAITSGAGNDTISGGAGNDTFTFAGSFATGDSIDAGDGTDTLSITTATVAVINAYAISTITALNDRVSGLERVTISDANTASLDLARVDGVNYLTLSAANTGAAVMSGFGANGTVTASVATNDFDVTLTDATGTADVFNIRTSNAATTDFGTITVGTSTAVVESVTVTSTEGSTPNSTVRVHTVALDGSGTKTVTLTGTESITTTIGSTALTTVDASGLTEGVANVTATASLVAVTATGSNQSDVFSTGSGADSVTGGLGDDQLTGGSGNDTLDGGVGADTIVNGVGVDSLVGGDGIDTISQTGWTISTTTDGGSTAVLGTVVNLGSSAVTAATIATYVGFGTASALNSDLTSVSSNTTALLGAAATVSSRVDTISGFENIVGSAGTDYLIGSSAANTINGGAGADVMTGGSGADLFELAGTASSIARSAESLTGTIANNDTITFGNGVDVIRDFVSGTDTIDLTVAGATTAPTSLVTGAGQAALVVGTAYFLLGTYVIGTGVFTVNTAATSATTNVAIALLEATTVDVADSVNHTDWVILTGIAAIAAADIV